MNGSLLSATANTPNPKHPRDVGLPASGAWLLAVFAPEGRGGQVQRCWRPDLLVEQQCQELMLSMPRAGNKLCKTWMLWTPQRRAPATGTTALQPENDRTLHDWIVETEAVL